MREIWKPVVGYEASHEVSNLGRVRAIARTIVSGRETLDGLVSPRLLKPKLLSTRVNERGYVAVDMCFQKGRSGRAMHRVVAEAFIGPAPSARHEVNHLDGDKLNNRLDNLEWVTPQQNSQHAYDTGLRVKIVGEALPTAKLTEQDVREIRRLLSCGHSQRSLARQFGICAPQVHLIAHRKAWAHVD